MRQTEETGGAPRQSFHLGEWLVEPELDRISRDGQVVQLRPRAMDVLRCLAQFAGELARKRELIDAVWRTEFVSEHALTQVIAELRAAFGDDARNPTYIENIPRRGYRLVAPVIALVSEPRVATEGEEAAEAGPDEPVVAGEEAAAESSSEESEG